MQEHKEISLSIAMENTKCKLNQTFKQIISDSKLPAYLIEGMITDILSQIRNQKNLELLSDINTMQSAETTEEA